MDKLEHGQMGHTMANTRWLRSYISWVSHKNSSFLFFSSNLNSQVGVRQPKEMIML